MSAIDENKSSYQKIVFTEPKSGNTISLVSKSQCEINNKGKIILAEYSREENKLRVVTRLGGTDSVTYFEIVEDGLRAPNGKNLVVKDSLKKLNEQDTRKDTTSFPAIGDIEDTTPITDPMSFYTAHEINLDELLSTRLRRDRADADINAIGSALEGYKLLSGGFYPTTQQGLRALVEKPSSTPVPRRWTKIMDAVPTDPWGEPYIYRFPGKRDNTKFELVSKGMDKTENTGDDLSSQNPK